MNDSPCDNQTETVLKIHQDTNLYQCTNKPEEEKYRNRRCSVTAQSLLKILDFQL